MEVMVGGVHFKIKARQRRIVSDQPLENGGFEEAGFARILPSIKRWSILGVKSRFWQSRT